MWSISGLYDTQKDLCNTKDYVLKYCIIENIKGIVEKEMAMEKLVSKCLEYSGCLIKLEVREGNDYC